MKIIQPFKAVMAILVLALASCSVPVNEGKKEGAKETVPSKIPKPMVLPNFKITDVNGTITDLQSLKGKKVFVNLWTTCVRHAGQRYLLLNNYKARWINKK